LIECDSISATHVPLGIGLQKAFADVEKYQPVAPRIRDDGTSTDLNVEGPRDDRTARSLKTRNGFNDGLNQKLGSWWSVFSV
jgi:hypothetical protein